MSSMTAFASNTTERVVKFDSFTGLYVKGSCEVDVRFNPDSVGYMIVRSTPQAIDDVEIALLSEKLYISATMQNDRKLNNIILYIPNTLSIVSLSERCRLTVSSDIVIKDDISLMTAGSSIIDVSNISADNINLSVTGSGKININSRVIASYANCSVTGSGKINIQSIESNSFSATLKGSGSINVGGKISNTASVAVKGRGHIDVARLSTVLLKAVVYGEGYINCSTKTKCQATGNVANIHKAL